MIIVWITMNGFPEKQKELMQTLLSMVGPMEKVAGCMSSTLFCNVGDKNRMNLIEEWQTRKDVELHFRSEIFGVLLGTNSLLRKPLEIQIFTVSDCEGIEAVHSARKKKN